MAGGQPRPDGVVGLSSDLLAALGRTLGSRPIRVHREDGSATTVDDAYTFVVPRGVWASDATLRSLVAAARAQSSHVAGLAAVELADVPAGMDVRGAIELHASGGAAVADGQPAAPAALLAPGTDFDATEDAVVWKGHGISVPDARVGTSATAFVVGEATRAARPVFRRSTVVAVTAEGVWTPRLVAWIADHRADPAIELRIVGPLEGAPPGCAPASGLESLHTIRPDVVVIDARQPHAGLEGALRPLSRAVVVELDDGAVCTSHGPGGRLRGTLGVNLDRDATVAALARWTSGPSVTPPAIVSADLPGGTHVQHPVSRQGVPTRTLGVLANGAHAQGRLGALVDVCRGMPDVETSVFVPESDVPPDVLLVGGPLGSARDHVVDAVRAGIGVIVDTYGVGPSDEIAALPADVRQRLLLCAAGTVAQRRLQAAFHTPVLVLPHVVVAPEPLVSQGGGTLVLAAQTVSTHAVEGALAALAGAPSDRVAYIGAPGPAAWAGLPPAPRQSAADADLVVVVGAGLDGVLMDTLALAARTGSVVVAQDSGEIQDLVDVEGLVVVGDDDWEHAVSHARDLVARGASAQVRSAARAWTGVQATRARVRRAVTVALGRATR